jgi:hypothetical protein
MKLIKRKNLKFSASDDSAGQATNWALCQLFTILWFNHDHRSLYVRVTSRKFGGFKSPLYEKSLCALQATDRR